MMMWTSLLVSRRSSRFSTCGLGVTALSMTRGGRLPPQRHVPATTSISRTRTGTFGQQVRHLSASASPDKEFYQQQQQQRPKNYLTAEDLGGHEGDSSSPQRIYVTLSDFEEDVESMAANYVPGPEDFLDDLEVDETVDGLSATSMLPDVPKSVKRAVQEAPVPKSAWTKGTSTPDNLDTSTTTSKGKTVAREPQRASKITTTTSTVTTGTQTYFTAKTASQSPSRTGKPALTDTFMAGIADPVWDNNNSNSNNNDDYSSERVSSPAKAFREDRTVDAVVMSEARRNFTTTSTTDAEKWSSLSRDEFRSKFAFDDQPLLPLTTLSTPPKTEPSRLENELHALQETLKTLDKQITTANNGSPINLSSYKQVSQALFGTPDESTSKDVLEAMAFSNILAKLILEHRQTQQRYNRLKKKIEMNKTSNKSTAATRATTSKPRSAESTDPLLLVDTSSLIFRAYYSMPPMHRADGMPISAVLGFCNLLNKMVLKPLMDGKQPRLVLCCDAPTPASGGPKTWRHGLYPLYKANRQEAPMDLIPQFPYFRLAAQAYGMMWIEAPGYEADDVIASLAQKALQEGLTTHIYSSDKDLMQLITNSTIAEQGPAGKIEMVEPSTMTLWTHDTVMEKWGVPAHQLGDVLALAGDAADNIPGVPGIGPKIAAQLLQQFGTLEELLSNLELVPQAKRREKLESYRDQAILSQQLVQLERNLNWDQIMIDFPDPAETPNQAPDRVADMKMQVMNPDRILRFYDQMGFVTIKERFLEQLQKRPQWQDAYAEATNGSFAAKRKSKWQSKDKVDVPKPEDFDNIPF